ncbi:MAG: site-specific integrase [Eubacteriales bacterium]|nr:site-specific integrase [Eubacteriales bacterium]
MEYLNLEELIENLLDSMSEQGYMESTISMYRSPFNKLINLSKQMSTDKLTPELSGAFVCDTLNERTGQYSSEKVRLRTRCIKLLEDYLANGKFVFKIYKKNKRQPFYSRYSDEIYSEFEQFLKTENISYSTTYSALLIAYRFLHYLESVGTESIDDAPYWVIPGFFGEMSKTWSHRGMHIIIDGLKRFLKFVDKDNHLLPCVPKARRTRPIIPTLTRNEESALWHMIDSKLIAPRDRAIILLSMLTGLRASDIVNLEIKDIDWTNDTISVVQRKTGTPLILPLVPAVGNAIMTYLLNDRPKSSSPKLFLRYDAPYRPLKGHSSCYAITKKIFALAGIREGNQRKGLHLLRHHTASKMLSNGVAIQTISSLLGHTDPDTTKLYLSTDREKLLGCCLPLPTEVKEALG